MDGIAAAASAEAGNSVSLALLKKSQDLEAVQAAALLQALPEPPPVSPSPPGLGGAVDIRA